MGNIKGDADLSLIILLAVGTVIGTVFLPGGSSSILPSFSPSKTHASFLISQSTQSTGLQMGILTITPTTVEDNLPPTSSPLTSCTADTNIPCTCIPATASVISCQYYIDCPVGGYARTFIPGASSQLGCLFDVGGSAGVYLNDVSCSSLSCP